MLNLSRKLHIKASSGNYYPALPAAAFLTWDTSSRMTIPRSKSTAVLFYLLVMCALMLHRANA